MAPTNEQRPATAPQGLGSVAAAGRDGRHPGDACFPGDARQARCRLRDPVQPSDINIALAIGGNLGDRAANLRDAVRRLVAGGVRVDAVSSLYETPPWGYTDQPSFLNGAIRGRTNRTPHDLLTLIKRIEHDLGREASFRNAPRPVDIDIALYGDCVINEPGLHIPHLGLPERAFVLVPLAEIAGAWKHPTLGKTIAELRAALGPADEIKQHLAPARWAYSSGEKAVSPAVRLAIEQRHTFPATVTVGKHTFDWANRVVVMGILNATPDSFSDGGKYFHCDDALRHAYEMAEQGATMIEVGGQSARPGALISVDEELCRIVPLLERLRGAIGLPLAVDTFRVGVARGAVTAGAVYINDISGGGDEDDGMARLAAETGVLLGIIHLRGKPKEKQWNTAYESVMDEVTGFLHERIGRAVGVGVAREKIIIDPGLGFGKEAPHDLAVMHHFSELRSFGLPILLATSRKNYLSDTMGRAVHDLLPETAAAVTYGIAQGANIIRVHDVAFMACIAQLMPHILHQTTR